MYSLTFEHWSLSIEEERNIFTICQWISRWTRLKRWSTVLSSSYLSTILTCFCTLMSLNWRRKNIKWIYQERLLIVHISIYFVNYFVLYKLFIHAPTIVNISIDIPSHYMCVTYIYKLNQGIKVKKSALLSCSLVWMSYSFSFELDRPKGLSLVELSWLEKSTL